MKTRDILGLSVSILDKVGAVELLHDALTKQKALLLAFVNANLANMAKSDRGLHQILQSFLLLNDGSGVGLASRWLYKEPLLTI